MYRMAVITDVHGNIYALKSVFQELKSQAIDGIVCLGDMIGIGPFSNEVCELLFSEEKVQMVTGNHDEGVLALIYGDTYPESRVKVKPHHQWIADRLHPSYIKALKQLPRAITKRVAGKTMHFTHYPMKREWLETPISKDPFDQAGVPNGENFSKLDAYAPDSIICFGHDHDVHHFSLNEQLFMGPGSLGCYHKPFARYAIIEIDSDRFKCYKKQEPYPLDTYVREMDRLSFPRKEVILKIFYKK